MVDSDLHRRVQRSRSVARNAELRDGWRQPGYSDLVVGSTAHPGHHYPRSVLIIVVMDTYLVIVRHAELHSKVCKHSAELIKSKC